MRDVPIDYSNPDEQAEVIQVGVLGWLRFRSRETGKVNERADIGEEHPHPIGEVTKWAAHWNKRGEALWPSWWAMATHERPLRARLAVDLLWRLKPAERVWMPVAPDVYRPLGRTLDLIEQLKSLPGEEPAILDVDAGHRFMITSADQIVVRARADGLGIKAPYAREEDLSVRLIGRMLDEGEVVLPRGFPAEG